MLIVGKGVQKLLSTALYVKLGPHDNMGSVVADPPCLGQQISYWRQGVLLDTGKEHGRAVLCFEAARKRLVSFGG